MLQKVSIENYKTIKGKELDQIVVTYELFGKDLYTAPVVLVNHALTGNSTVCGEQGWWKGLIGEGKCINTKDYTILAFNIPGNGYDGIEENLIQDYQSFTARDVAKIFNQVIKQLEIQKIFATIGGSVGGGIAWELAVLNPSLIEHLIPVAADWKSTDWLKANCLVQEQILLNSKNPVHDARLHAMLFYRSPESFKIKFNRSFNEDWGVYNVESWLLHHGKKLKERFTLSAYKTLNHILANIDITSRGETFEEVVKNIRSNIHLISVDSDIFFTAKEDTETFYRLTKVKNNVSHHIIASVHGHDAFLIEFEQLEKILDPIFKNEIR
ncbi:alpha/beta fold hydrolase [Aquimarina sp. ERC-38]|uniref:alpha/beta fold hydrolase n=1 Tax=Aquimarina sp. ERC-38 TaxID=2949996 RepID=UPI0022463FFE|nr:alpha/beta fold hydrolase [Aquimarina sp. ERC-38]UZO81012.1 alpha/beta fold hydrolase [Aquimarina sp. ERC-38]